MPHVHHAAAGSLESVFLVLTILFTAALYLRGWVYLRSISPSLISGWRAASFVTGLSMIWIATASSLAPLDHKLLTVHMLQHLLLMTLAPPLIWLGEPLGPLLQGLPQRLVQRALAPAFQWLRTHKITTALARPELGWLAATAVLVGWHIPAVFALGMQSEPWHFVEQASFLASGLLFWWPVVQPWPSVSRPDLSIILYLFFATLPCDILSGFLAFCDRVIYPMYFSPSHFGFSAIEDQQCAAALMWTGVTMVYLVAGGILTVQLLSRQSSHAFPAALRVGQIVVFAPRLMIEKTDDYFARMEPRIETSTADCAAGERDAAPRQRRG